jgi:hypothetical protein
LQQCQQSSDLTNEHPSKQLPKPSQQTIMRAIRRPRKQQTQTFSPAIRKQPMTSCPKIFFFLVLSICWEAAKKQGVRENNNKKAINQTT